MPAFQGSSDSEFPVVGMKDNQEKAGDNESEFEFEYDPTETEVSSPGSFISSDMQGVMCCLLTL